MTPPEASRHRLQRGVITAVLHIASVRDAGARPLAIEFSTALDKVRGALADARMPDELKQCFLGNSLRLQFLRTVAEHREFGVRRLRGLEPTALDAIDEHYRKQYVSLVAVAANAAYDAEIDDGPYRRRSRSRLERAALANIHKAIERYEQQ